MSYESQSLNIESNVKIKNLHTQPDNICRNQQPQTEKVVHERTIWAN